MPRDNAPVDVTIEAPMGISRTKSHPLNRMRNPWIYLKLKNNPVITYSCCKNVGSFTKGFVIPKTEFESYLEETGNTTCGITAVDKRITYGPNQAMQVLYHLVDTTDDYAIKSTYDSQTYFQIPCYAFNVQDTIDLMTAQGADAMFVDCGRCTFDPSYLELTISRTRDVTRTEIHDLNMTYFD